MSAVRWGSAGRATCDQGGRLALDDGPDGLGRKPHDHCRHLSCILPRVPAGIVRTGGGALRRDDAPRLHGTPTPLTTHCLLAVSRPFCAIFPPFSRVVRLLGATTERTRWRNLGVKWTENFGETASGKLCWGQMATDDAQEGGRAFREKREPVWTGKSRL